MDRSSSGILNILLCMDVMNDLIKTSIMLAISNIPIFKIDAHPSSSVSCESVIIIIFIY